MIRIAHQSTDLSIAKEVMSAKREMRKYPKKSNQKQTDGEIQALDVDNFSNFIKNVEYRNLMGQGRI